MSKPTLTRLIAAHIPVVLLVLLVIATAFFRIKKGQAPGFGLQDLFGIGGGKYPDIAATIGIPRPQLLEELNAQLTWPVTSIAAIGIGSAVLLGDWRQRWLVATATIPLLAVGFLAEFWYSRYLLFTLPPLTVAAVCGWRRLLAMMPRLRHAVEFAVITACACIMGYQSALLIYNPVAAHWSALDRFQYFSGWGSGYGFAEAARFVDKAANGPAVIYSLDGHSAYQLSVYLPREWSGRVRAIFYADDGSRLHSDKANLANLLSHTPVWVIVSKQLLVRYLETSFGSYSSQIKLREIAEIEKPDFRTQLALYEVTIPQDHVMTSE